MGGTNAVVESLRRAYANVGEKGRLLLPVHAGAEGVRQAGRPPGDPVEPVQVEGET